MSKNLLHETILLFKTGGEKDLNGRMERACLCDLDRLKDRMNVEIDALPPDQRKIIRKAVMDYLKDLVGGKLYGDKDS